MTSARSPRVLFVHAGGRRRRLARLDEGEAVPREFFYGLTELRERGFEVDLFETSDGEHQPRSWRYRWTERKDKRRRAATSMPHCERFFLPLAKHLHAYDAVIAGNEYVALGLLDLVKRHAPKKPFAFFVMGMLSKAMAGGSAHREAALARYRRLLAEASAALFLGAGELEAFRGWLPDHRKKMQFHPFGVDTDFWTPCDRQDAEPADAPILFVGNDVNRDVDLLTALAAAMPEHRFLALTSLIKDQPLPANLEVIESHWKRDVVSDQDMRAHYRAAQAVILPIKPTFQPSGQSVALQAMACGRPVVISDFDGFWEPDAGSDDSGLIHVQPSDVTGFASALRHLFDDPTRAEAIGRQARQQVEHRYTLRHFGERLAAQLEACR
ncbi:MAG: glycosyltransferase family 4 protein [Alphaproteobacteria bacterium]|nr:glycosyltransferase family 4 protein [Alphaproteobacteria bacterium]